MSKLLLSQRNSKKFKWIPDSNLCQSKYRPSKLRSKAEENLLAKTTGMLDSYRMKFDDAPPALACVPQIKWKCPPVFIINNDWRVVAGEQSEETRTQMVRQLKVLEAIYPRQSAIPSSPSVSPGLEECDYDDHEVPLIPIRPCEEEDAVDYESKTYPISSSAPVQQEAVKFAQHITLEESKVAVNVKSVEIHTGLEGGVLTAAITAFAELMERYKSGQIDTGLLGNILNDPKKSETLAFDSTKLTPMNEPMSATSVSLPSIDCLSTVFQKPVNEHSNMHNVQQSSRFASNVLTNLGATQVPKLPSSLQTTMPSMNSTFLASMMNREPQPFFWTTMPIMRSISQAFMTNIQPSMALLPGHGLLHEHYGKENQNFLPETQFHPLMSFPPYAFSSDGLISPTVATVNTRVVRDVSYYRRLIELHGTDKSGGREEIMHRYIPRTSELAPAAGKRDARGKIPKPCKFFNSPRGCRNGLTCLFQHDSSLKLQAGRLADVYSNKRIKLSKEIS